jgi:hypothetical protein
MGKKWHENLPTDGETRLCGASAKDSDVDSEAEETEQDGGEAGRIQVHGSFQG